MSLFQVYILLEMRIRKYVLRAIVSNVRHIVLINILFLVYTLCTLETYVIFGDIYRRAIGDFHKATKILQVVSALYNSTEINIPFVDRLNDNLCFLIKYSTSLKKGVFQNYFGSGASTKSIERPVSHLTNHKRFRPTMPNYERF